MSDEQAGKQPGSTDPTSDRSEDADGRQRRWYHPRPNPRCRADVAGFNYSYWLFAFLLLVVVLLPW